MRIDPKARERARIAYASSPSRKWGVSMERRIEELNRFTVGWTAYYWLADAATPFEKLDQWRKLRAAGIPERGP